MSILSVVLAVILFSPAEIEAPVSFAPSVKANPLPIPPKTLLDETLPPDEGNVSASTSTPFISLINVAEASSSPIYCSCVRTSRLFNPNLPLKDAKDLVPNSEPVIGGQILFYYPKSDTWHVATIEKFTKDGFQIVEGNFEKCDKTRRLVYYNDPFIKGFIK